jgi:carboxylesterase
MVEPLPFFLSGSLVGCLLIHGFTGAPPEVRLVGDYMHAHGLTVSGPLLPGHGTTPQEMAQCHWQDWAEAAERAYQELAAQCTRVFVGGLSMGALLATHLAAKHPEVAGLIAYSPALVVADWKLPLAPLACHLLPFTPAGSSDLTDPEAHGYLWHYAQRSTAAAAELWRLQRVVRRELAQVQAPALVVYSTGDHAIHPSSATRFFAALPVSDKELVTLRNSGHCLTVDTERDQVFARTYGFVAAHSDRSV